MADQPTHHHAVSSTEATAARRAEMTDFVRLLLTDRNPRAAYERYAAPDMVNHNLRMGPDRAGVIAGNEKVIGTPGATFEVQNILVDGNMTVLRYHGILTPGNPGAEVVEFFRWDGPKIVEHWDVFQLTPAPTAKASK